LLVVFLRFSGLADERVRHAHGAQGSRFLIGWRQFNGFGDVLSRLGVVALKVKGNAGRQVRVGKVRLSFHRLLEER
jgi:hypothetical protein